VEAGVVDPQVMGEFVQDRPPYLFF